MWRDSMSPRGFVPLLAHKTLYRTFFELSHIVLEENYIAILIVIELSPSPTVNIILSKQNHNSFTGVLMSDYIMMYIFMNILNVLELLG